MNAMEPYWYLVHIGLGSGFVMSGNKPLPELMLIQKYIAIWHHQAKNTYINTVYLYFNSYKSFFATTWGFSVHELFCCPGFIPKPTDDSFT